MKKNYMAPAVELTYMTEATMLMTSGPLKSNEDADQQGEVGTKEYERDFSSTNVWGEEW